MWYCEKHGHFDENYADDYPGGCPFCEAEEEAAIEEDRKLDERRLERADGTL